MGTKAFFAAKVPGGLDELYRVIDEPELRAFIQQKFLPCAWYDVLPAVPLIKAEAKAMRHTVRRYLQLRSGYQAEQDLSGVYRFLLKLASTEGVALRLPQLFTQIFDFGSSEATVVEPGHVTASVKNFPAVLYDWFASSLEVYAATALRLTNARDCTVVARRIDSARGAATATLLASMQLDVRWRP